MLSMGMLTDAVSADVCGRYHVHLQTRVSDDGVLYLCIHVYGSVVTMKSGSEKNKSMGKIAEARRPGCHYTQIFG